MTATAKPKLSIVSEAPLASDIALAELFAAEAIFDFRWTPGMGWMVFNGQVWERDAKLRRYDRAKTIAMRHAADATSEAEARRIASAKTVSAILTLAQAEPQLVVSADQWDADQMVIATPGGIVDLRTGALKPTGVAYVTQCARIAPDATQHCPLWLKFLVDVFQGDKPMVEFMRRAIGYWLTGDRREQVIFFLHGSGSNGKSVFIDLVQWLLGTYSLKLPEGVLMQSKYDRHSTELAQLHGKRLAVSSELEENAFFNESLIKQLTGDEVLTARFMRQDFFQFAMSQKHVVIGNFKPRLRGGDPAMARRMLLIPFNAKFEGAARDLTILDKLKAEGAAIMAWAVQGAIDWHGDGLHIPASVRSASAEYMGDHDDLAMWIEECCHRHGEAKASRLYDSFARWKKDRGEHAPSQTVWGSRISALEGISKRRANGIWYAGLQLTIDEMERLNARAF